MATASDISSDPNSITDPTGGAPNFNILDIFQSYGYQPTQAEIDSIAPAFQGRTDVGETGRDAVASYVQAHQELKGAQSDIQGNLLTEQQSEAMYTNLSTILATNGQAAYQQAADLFSQAPQLFGSMTPDQINEYLAPLKSSFDYSSGSVQGTEAARGLTGSSLEAAALGLTQNQFNQSVLQTGLNVGMTQQQQRAQALQQLGSGQLGLAGTFGGLGANYGTLANNSATANAGIAGSLAGLPGQAVNQAMAQYAAIQALNPKSSSFLGGLASGFENMAQQDILNLGQNIIQSTLPMTSPGVNGPNLIQNLLGAGRTPTGAPSTASSGAGAGSYLGWTPAGNPNLNFTGGLNSAGPSAGPLVSGLGLAP